MKHLHWLDHPGDEADFVGKQVVKTKSGFAVAVPPVYVEKMAKVAGLEGAKASWVPGTKEADRPLIPDANEYVGEASHSLYRTVVGMLLWLSFERPDIQFSVKRLSQSLQQPLQGDWLAMRRVVRYLLGTATATLRYEANPAKAKKKLDLDIWTDSDWAGCPRTRRSTSGGGVWLQECLLASWSRCQQSVSTSSAEAEYYSMCGGAAEGVFVAALAE